MGREARLNARVRQQKQTMLLARRVANEALDASLKTATRENHLRTKPSIVSRFVAFLLHRKV